MPAARRRRGRRGHERARRTPPRPHDRRGDGPGRDRRAAARSAVLRARPGAAAQLAVGPGLVRRPARHRDGRHPPALGVRRRDRRRHRRHRRRGAARRARGDGVPRAAERPVRGRRPALVRRLRDVGAALVLRRRGRHGGRARAVRLRPRGRARRRRAAAAPARRPRPRGRDGARLRHVQRRPAVVRPRRRHRLDPRDGPRGAVRRRRARRRGLGRGVGGPHRQQAAHARRDGGRRGAADAASRHRRTARRRTAHGGVRAAEGPAPRRQLRPRDPARGQCLPSRAAAEGRWHGAWPHARPPPRRGPRGRRAARHRVGRDVRRRGRAPRVPPHDAGLGHPRTPRARGRRRPVTAAPRPRLGGLGETPRMFTCGDGARVGSATGLRAVRGKSADRTPIRAKALTGDAAGHARPPSGRFAKRY
ncbi:MAG TPA: hypothetical protein VNQ77_05940 [Frankiaceae bacterium]|nr:hypothetical protein [Frankiaceae bacterium]